MAEKKQPGRGKPTGTKSKTKKAEEPKLTCNERLSDGKLCPKTVEKGKTLCRWHDPLDSSWRAIYKDLESASPEEKVDIVLELIEAHPEHHLVLHERDGKKANLAKIDLSQEGIKKKKRDLAGAIRPWWSFHNIAELSKAKLQGADLRDANLQGANLLFANLQDADMPRANLQYTGLQYANLKNTNLAWGNLEGADLDSADLQDAWLLDADLRKSRAGRAKLQKAILRGANLEGADFEDANLQGADLRLTNLKDAKFLRAILQEADLWGANLQGADLRDTKLQGVDLSNVSDMSGVFISRAWLDKNRLRREHLGNGIGEEARRQFGTAKIAYLALKQNFEELGDYEGASWAYCKERRMEKFEAWEQGRLDLSNYKVRAALANYLKFFSDTFVEWLCDYGESVWRVIGWMVIMLFVAEPLSLSLLGGFGWDYDLARNYLALSSSWNKFWYSYWLHLLYSLGGIGTSGFFGLQPANLVVDLASSLFSIIDIFLVGLLGFVAGNRIRRS